LFGRQNTLVSIFAVKSAPPVQAASAGHAAASGGIRKKSVGYTPMK
jgi:hypothetical protein